MNVCYLTNIHEDVKRLKKPEQCRIPGEQVPLKQHD